MEETNYTVEEVIEALQSVGIAEEIIEYVVPIAGYESRVGGVPFTRDALDKESPSWGIFQANLNSMAPSIYKAMKELGVELPGVTDEQDKVLLKNVAQPGQQSLLKFSSKQKKFAAEWFKTQANLKDNALVFKYMLEQKLKDINSDDYKEAMKELYVLTIDKFNDPNNTDAQKLKQEIEKQVKEIMSGEKTEVPSDAVDPERLYTPGYEPGTGRPLDNGKTIPFTKNVSTARESTLRSKQAESYGRVTQMLEAQVNKQKKAVGQEPINTVVPEPTLSDSVKAALKLLTR